MDGSSGCKNDSLATLVQEQATKTPDGVAVIYDDGIHESRSVTITYKEMWDRAANVCDSLRKHGVQSETVGVCMEPGINLPSVVLGILQTSSCFYPFGVDGTGFVKQALQRQSVQTIVLDDTSLQLLEPMLLQLDAQVLTCPDLLCMGLYLLRLSPVTAASHDLDPPPVKKMSGLAYCITTSGTTGTPKLVQVPHMCIIPNIMDLRQEFEATVADVAFLASPLTFDPCMIDIFVTLTSGAALLIVPPAVKMSPGVLLTKLHLHHRVTILQLTPTLLGRFSLTELKKTLLGRDSALRVMAVGGEPFPSHFLTAAVDLENCTAVYNLYGITEVSCWASVHCVRRPLGHFEEPACIGRSLNGTKVKVVDDTGGDVLQGTGEIWIGSSERVCLLNDEAHDMLTGRVVWRATGDHGRVDEHGHVFCLGRNDCQIKRNGKRLNLRTIEKVCGELQGIDDSRAVWNEDKLYVFVVTKGDSDEEGKAVTRVKSHLMATLPSQYQPDVIRIVHSLPISTHGKLDTATLLAMCEVDAEADRAGVPLDVWALALWQECIGDSSRDVAPTDSFVTCGGDSLKAVRLAEMVVGRLDRRVDGLLEAILTATYADFAALLKEQSSVSSVKHSLKRKQQLHNKSTVKRARVLQSSLPVRLDKNEDEVVGVRENQLNGGLMGTDVASPVGDVVDTPATTAVLLHDVSVEMKNLTPLCMQPPVLFTVPVAACTRRLKTVLRGLNHDGDAGSTESSESPANVSTSSSKLGQHCAGEVFTAGRPNRTPSKASKFCSATAHTPVGNNAKSDTQTASSTTWISSPQSHTDIDNFVTSVSRGGNVQHCCLRHVPGCEVGNVQSPENPPVNVSMLNTALLCARSGRGLCGCHVRQTRLKLVLDWRVSTGKCVDSSPLVAVTRSGEKVVYLGSHSHCFYAIAMATGTVLWCTQLGGRVEGSACLSACGRWVVVGCYDHKIYTLDAHTGGVVWQVETGDVVKCTPVTDVSSGITLCGSHDGSLYALHCQDQCVLWRREMGGGSVFASPALSPDGSTVFVTTLAGHVTALKLDSGQTVWSADLQKPVFSSLVLDDRHLYVGCVDGCLYCLKLNSGEQDWVFKTEGPIFSSPVVTKCGQETVILFGSHDQHLYCVTSSGQLVWQNSAAATVFASPFVFHFTKNMPRSVSTQSHNSVNNHSACVCNDGCRKMVDACKRDVDTVKINTDQSSHYSSTQSEPLVHAVTATVNITGGCMHKGVKGTVHIKGGKEERVVTSMRRSATDPASSVHYTASVQSQLSSGINENQILKQKSDSELTNKNCKLKQKSDENHMLEQKSDSELTNENHVYEQKSDSELNCSVRDPSVHKECSHHSCSERHSGLVACASTDGTVFILDGETGLEVGSVEMPGDAFSSPVVSGNQLVVGCRDNYVYCYKIDPCSQDLF